MTGRGTQRNKSTKGNPMLTTEEYAAKAEEQIAKYNPDARYAMTPISVSLAQVYATLALAAATTDK
jgi:hypothetical protein